MSDRECKLCSLWYTLLAICVNLHICIHTEESVSIQTSKKTWILKTQLSGAI